MVIILSCLKAYNLAKFQKNAVRGLARMMVQKYRQTDAQTDRQISPFIYIGDAYIYIYIYIYKVVTCV